MQSKALAIGRIDCSEDRQQKVYFTCQYFTYRSIIRDLSLSESSKHLALGTMILFFPKVLTLS